MTFNKINPINYNFHKIEKSYRTRASVSVPLVSITNVGFYLNAPATKKMKNFSEYYQIYFDSDNDIVLFAFSNEHSSGRSKLVYSKEKFANLNNKTAMKIVVDSNPQLNLRNYNYKWKMTEYSDNELSGFAFKPSERPFSKKLRKNPMKF